VLLDAGGVLVELDFPYLLRLIGPRTPELTCDDLGRAEALARTEVNRHVGDGGRVGDLWRDYFHMILGSVGVPHTEQARTIDALWEAHERVGLWIVACAGALEVVQELKRRGYRIAVVSNAEGRVERDLSSAGYDGLFETVVDSHLVGVEKPDPEIFNIALGRIGRDRESSVFVGDVPSVDVAGARAADIAPILLDPYDLYGDQEVDRIRSLAELLDLLPSRGRSG